MRVFLPLFLCFFVLGSAVPTVNYWGHVKTKPDHVGIDDELRGFETIYKVEAAVHGIKFKTPVTIGFSNIKGKKGKGTIVGLCTYGKNFREIDVDVDFWNKSTWKTKRTLIYHEMTHCMCSRLHTWQNGEYPEVDSDIEVIIDRPFYKDPPGMLSDDCPASIMYPYVVSDECVDKHWSYYQNEMFEKCSPY